jgi:alpha-L-fucosidase 2
MDKFMGGSTILLFILLFVISCTNSTQEEVSDLKLWYQQPGNATLADEPNVGKDDPHWLEAMPVGNGAFGAMIFGDVHRERIQLNEESMWTGSPDDNDNPLAYPALDSIRQLLFAGKFKEASELTQKTQVCKGVGSGYGSGADDPFGSFQTLGDLRLDFATEGNYTDYYRELDLQTAVAKVEYTLNDVRYKREIFASHPDQVIVIRLTADQPGRLSFRANLDRPESYATTAETDQLVMSGRLHDGKGGKKLAYMTRMRALNQGGEVTYADSTLTVSNADEVVLLLTASTNYQLKAPDYEGRDYERLSLEALDKASAKSYDALLEAHLREYQGYFQRVELELNTLDSLTAVPTDERLAAYQADQHDAYLEALMFHYGRYLLISSSRPGTLPANLQGIWSNKLQSPWNGDYHTDINIQMNYWLADVTNLSEIHLPFFDLLGSLMEPGAKTAQVHYRADGWVVHPITNVWGYTSPGEGSSWGMHSAAGGWMCQHIMEHYRFTQDKTFLEKMLPVLEGSTAFYLDWLVVNPETGKLVSGPAVSPENTFLAPDGSKCQISMGPAHDQQVIWQLFTDYLEACDALGIDGRLSQQVSEAREQLAGPQIGSDGRLLEWPEEWPEAEPGHRHISHMYAIHPGSQFSLSQTPELAAAAKRSLDYRIAHGGGHTGWSAAWLISQYARLQEAEKAKHSLETVLAKSTSPNLFGQHPPFQMDANFGYTAGVAEMLLQSHTDVIQLLPALPSAWTNGRVRGMRARGGYTIDMTWDDGKLTVAKIRADREGAVKLAYGEKVEEVSLGAGESREVRF